MVEKNKVMIDPYVKEIYVAGADFFSALDWQERPCVLNDDLRPPVISLSTAKTKSSVPKISEKWGIICDEQLTDQGELVLADLVTEVISQLKISSTSLDLLRIGEKEMNALFLRDLLKQKGVTRVMTIGANTLAQLIGEEKRLALCHGKWIVWENYHIYPLFHVDLMAINPNMKQSTWQDLEKLKEGVNIT